MIVGAGTAGAECAIALRQFGYTGRVQLLGGEPHFPYKRPPLSKSHLSLDHDPNLQFIRPAAMYARLNIEVLVEAPIVGLDRSGKSVVSEDGIRFQFSKLVLAVGGKARKLDAGVSCPVGVHYLRTSADAYSLRAAMSIGKNILVVGGGYIGLEVAASAIGQGLRVVLVESAPRVLSRTVAADVSTFLADVHAAAGVDIRTRAGVAHFQFDSRGLCGAVLSDGTEVECDIAVVGIGLSLDTAFARDAGIAVDSSGIIVDESCRTSDQDVFAIGDCASQPNPWAGQRMRIESVASATEQARTAAATICGKAPPAQSVPWFWSDQYDLRMQTVGISGLYDNLVVNADLGARTLSAYYLREGTLVAADFVNQPLKVQEAKALITARAPVDVSGF